MLCVDVRVKGKHDDGVVDCCFRLCNCQRDSLLNCNLRKSYFKKTRNIKQYLTFWVDCNLVGVLTAVISADHRKLGDGDSVGDA